MVTEHKPIGNSPFFTYKSGNGKYGLAAQGARRPGLATGAIYDSPDDAIGAGLDRMTRRIVQLEKQIQEWESEQ